MTTQEVADFFDVYRGLVYRWVRSGILNPISKSGGGGGGRRFSSEDVRSLLPEKLRDEEVVLLSPAGITSRLRGATDDELTSWRVRGVLTEVTLPQLSSKSHYRYVLSEVVEARRIPSGKAFYSLDELVKLLSVTEATLRLAIEQGALQIDKPLGEALFPPIAVRTYLVNQLYAK